jgi:hypothetical protein
MAYQRGSLKKVKRKEGGTWVLRYRVSNADGRRVENALPNRPRSEFPEREGRMARGGEAQPDRAH